MEVTDYKMMSVCRTFGNEIIHQLDYDGMRLTKK